MDFGTEIIGCAGELLVDYKRQPHYATPMFCIADSGPERRALRQLDQYIAGLEAGLLTNIGIGARSPACGSLQVWHRSYSVCPSEWFSLVAGRGDRILGKILRLAFSWQFDSV